MKNTIWVAAAQAGSGLLRIVLIVYAMRMIGVSEWGIFSYALGITGVLALFSDIGMTSFVMREMSKSADNSNQYFATAFFVKIGIYIIGTIGILGGAQFLSLATPVFRLLPFLLVVMILDGLHDLTNVLARSSEKMQIEALVNTGAALMQMIVGFILLSISPSSEMLAAAYVIGSGSGLLALILIFKKYFGNILHLARLSLVKPLVKQSWPLCLAVFTGTIMINTDIIIIGALLTSHDVGIYSAAYRFVQIATMVLGLIVVPLIPVMARFADDTARFTNLMKKSIQGSLLISIPIMAGGLASAPTIISFLYGDAYLPATPILRILIMTVLVSFPSIIMSTGLYAQKKERYLTIYSIIGIFTNLFLNLILISSFGVVGISYSTLVVQIILFLFLLSVSPNIGMMDIGKGLWKISAASVIMVFYIVIAQRIGLVDLAVLGGATLTFGVAIVLLKERYLQEIKSAFAS
ncbi:flippase [Candidatus Uhrbacteria bacterium]|nr:flippase [Candidatus Uhrbacteria bacterium]